VTIAGQGLHGGAPSTIRFARRDGETAIRRGDALAPLSALEVVGTARSTTVSDREGRVRLATVEHLFAALAACGARAGVEIAIDGAEVPLADGGARAFLDAVRALRAPAAPPGLTVARAGTIAVGESVYELSPGDGVCVEVEIDFGDPRLAPRARWDGDADDFAERIAPARTFGFEREVGELLERGLASHVRPESVVVLCERAVLAAGRPFEADEPARHKLLDLVGDLFAHGGPPRGRVFARRPGHAATHEAARRALAEGLLVAAL
jgi:UDP-3-O-[3-hydroxymyristoyl] N-acetylglucosamine deacetylase